MVPEELKHRISLLQRGELPARREAGISDSAARASADLARHFPEGGICHTPRGDFFVCEVSLEGIHSNADTLTAAYLGAFDNARRLAQRAQLPRFLEALADAGSEATALIDTETAGLHGRPLFLIGLLRWRDDGLVLTQYFARTYAEEAGVLDHFADRLREVELLISFNGKAFDWPFVRDRMVYHRLESEARFAHLDLLHPSRRRWRSRLPNCRLQTLERYLCGRWRTGDVPGEEIPQRYHDFVRAQDARLIAPIFRHNRLDLITMMELLIALVDGGAPEHLAPGRTPEASIAAKPSAGRA